MAAKKLKVLGNGKILSYDRAMLNTNQNLTCFMTAALLLICLLLMLAGCDRQEKVVSKQSILSELNVWVHTGNEESLLLRKDQVARFNARHSRIKVTLISIPKGTYSAQISAATRTGTLPDIIELDGPSLASFVTRGALVKLDKILTTTTRQDILPSVFEQGMYQGRVYSVAETTNSFVLYARKSLLASAGYPVPENPGDAWDLKEFETLLAMAQKHGDYSAAIDIGLSNVEEPYAKTLYPMLLSAGGGLVDGQSPYKVEGLLNSATNIGFLKRIQRWIDQGYIDENSDHRAFSDGRVALSWGGLDKYVAYKALFDDDLVVVPFPDLGGGSRNVHQTWGWSLTENCEDTQAAMRFLEFLFLPDEANLAAKASGGLPGTFSGLSGFNAFSDSILISSLVSDLESGMVASQAKSPLYPVISDEFQKSFVRIRSGASVEESLEAAVDSINQQRQKFKAELAEEGI